MAIHAYYIGIIKHGSSTTRLETTHTTITAIESVVSFTTQSFYSYTEEVKGYNSENGTMAGYKIIILSSWFEMNIWSLSKDIRP